MSGRRRREEHYGHGILRHFCVVRKDSEERTGLRTVPIGTMIEIFDYNRDDVLFTIVKNNIQSSDFFQCKRGDIYFVSENFWGPLLGVQESRRLPLIENPALADALSKITVGNTVRVLGHDNRDICIGTVIFKNYVAKLGAGVYYGLNIKSSRAIQILLRERISVLEPGTKGFPRGVDVLVGIDKLLPVDFDIGTERVLATEVRKFFAEWNNGNGSGSGGSQDEEPSSSYGSRSKKRDIKQCLCKVSLLAGERVVYLDGDVPELATVKWLGSVNDYVKVGVIFDNPIGERTGERDGGGLFRPRSAYAAVLPPEDLIKLSDFRAYTAIEVDDQNDNNNSGIENNACCIQRGAEAAQYEIPINPRRFRISSYVCTQCGEDCRKGSKCCVCSIEHKPVVELVPGRYVETPILCTESLSLTPRYRYDDRDLTEENGYIRTPVRVVSVEPSPRETLAEYLDCYEQEELMYVTVEDPNEQSGDGEADSSEPEAEAEAGAGAGAGAQSLESQGVKKKVPESKADKATEGRPGESKEDDEEEEEDEDREKKIFDYLLTEDIGVGTPVEFLCHGQAFYGIIRWTGVIPDEGPVPETYAGIEVEEEKYYFTDGTYHGHRYFECKPYRAVFVPLSDCRKDSRALDKKKRKISLKLDGHSFDDLDNQVIRGAVPPIKNCNLDMICGKFRGIQGHHNSCYLDASIFSMFAFTCVFDSLLFRPRVQCDAPQYDEVQRLLREEIVNPLRKTLYVRGDRVMKLRKLLGSLSKTSGFTSDEKDPEEFLHSLLSQVLNVDPYLKLNSGQGTFHYQLFVEKDYTLLFPTVQQLFEQSFINANLKLTQIPPCLIIQMPRFGKSFKMYPRIYPSLTLDITDILDNSPRQCTVCGNLAEYECEDCFGQGGIGSGLESTSFCKKCLYTAHSHYCRMRHLYRHITVPVDYHVLQDHGIIPRTHMELFAVVCIETSHYVAFAKCGSGIDAPWCFFDSMADRKGEKNGFNIPEIVPCPDLPYWLSKEGMKSLDAIRDERHLPELAKRLLCDAYMCLYQSEDAMMYR